MHLSYRFSILPALLVAVAASGQISEGGLPPSVNPEFEAVFKATPTPIQLPSLDVDNYFNEDSKQPEVVRFSAPLPTVDISPTQTGQWTKLPNGDRVWRCAIQSPNALGLLLIFDQFQLAPGSKFFAYSANQKKVLGAYTQESCLPSGQFLIGILPGDQAMLELWEPAAVIGQSTVHLNRVDYVYDPAGMMPAEAPEDFGQSYACNVNVNCPGGQNWQTEKRGVARILMIFSNGAGWCSGSLLANTSTNGDPYFLTAHHCQIIGLLPNFSIWRFDFDYEAGGCSNPATEPAKKSVLGCERISYRHETDFLLLKLTQIPGSYNLYYNGWNRTPATNTNVPNSTFIHHPVGDIKKISVDNHPAVIFTQVINWGASFGSTPGSSHWSVIPEVGIYQPGSSGCPLFDPNKRIVGQLHGGNLDTVTCKVLNSWFGRFDHSWDQGATPESRLKEWLDPTNTNALTQNGYIQPAPTTINISGAVKTHWDAPMPDVLVSLSGGTVATTRTDANGAFTFQNLPAGLNFKVTPSRDTNTVNGITTFDLSQINKHILSLDTLDTAWQIIAADANGSNTITTIDVVECRKILLGLNPAFPTLPSWRFFPALTTFPNPNNPFSNALPPGFLEYNALQDNVTDANFNAVKVGDVNGNAKSGG